MKTPKRQKEIKELVNCLKKYNPSKILIESAYNNNYYVDRYKDFLKHANEETLSRNEIEQVAFRLAVQLNHETIYPFDFKIQLDSGPIEKLMKEDPHFTEEWNQFFPRIKTFFGTVNNNLKTKTILDYLNPSPTRSSITFDYVGAAAMLEVIRAIHEKRDKERVEELIDSALKLNSYKICEERYTNPDRSKNNQVSLSEYKKFIMSFLRESVDTQGNRRIGFLKEYYMDAVKNPEKYTKALQIIMSIPDSSIQDALNKAFHWLPDGIEMNVNVIILFDIGGGAWIEKTKDGRNHVAFNILLFLDDKSNFDSENFLGTLAHELHHVGIEGPIEKYSNSINYRNLNDTSSLKLFTDYIEPKITEGFAQKFCSNAPGKFSPKPYPDRKFAAIEIARKNWEYFLSEFEDIHKRAISDFIKILSGEIINREGRVEADAKRFELPFPVLVGRDSDITKNYKIKSLPQLVIIDIFNFTPPSP